MQTLQYGNNIIPLTQGSPNGQVNNSQRRNKWMKISPQEVVLHGMLLTANFNIENSHQHLSINFQIKSFLNDQQLPFVEIFPQRGNIMRGQVKKIRVKFSKQFTPQQSYNDGSMILRIYVNLNTQWNKQYMMANKLRGWSQIKNLPIEQYELPIIISDEFLDLKQNIRKSVVFQSQFAKVSQDMSSLYGDEKFQVPEAQIYSKNLLQNKKIKTLNIDNNLSGRNPFNGIDRRSMGSFSENKRSRFSNSNSRSKGAMREVYFGNEPKIVESKVELSNYKLKRSSMSQKRNSSNRQNKDMKINIPKVASGINNPFSTQQPLFQQFSDRKLSINSKPQLESSFQNHEDSSISILRSLEKRNSQVQRFQLQKQQYEKGYQRNEQQVFKDFKTVGHHFDQPLRADHSSNKRSMEIIVLAIIAGFFVALGSNVARLFY